MGEDLRRLLEEGVRIVYGARSELERFVAVHHVSPSLVQLLEELRITFRTSVEALGWLNRRSSALDGSPYDLIANGEAWRVVRMLSSHDVVMSA
ncbi:MAG: hypothetical protein ACREK1_05120 [Longimicrobiales bacterium]